MSRSEVEHATVPLAKAVRGSHSGFGNLSADIQDSLYRRLGGVGLLYSGAWVSAFIFYRLAPHAVGDAGREVFWYAATATCTAVGLAVYLLCRSRRIPPHLFWNVAMAFEIGASIGIMVGWLGWEHHGLDMLQRVAIAFGLDTTDLASSVVAPLSGQRTRILYHEGLSWLSMWIIAFPLVVPLSLTRTLVTTLSSAATVPLVLLLSLAVYGVPDAIRPWLTPYLLEISVPTFISAGVAIFGSRVVYRLTRDLSDARRLGSYQLVERIGAGGMGEVWRAKHRLLVRPAAIKLIRPEVLGGDGASPETALKRFEREAQATSGLSSAHSIELYDFGVADDGSFYYVMELLHGIDLKTLVERYGPISAERTVHILRQACHSLTDAHMTGVVHRDIKPGNIFLCRRGADYDFVKVLDFGLVKQVGESEPRGAQLTVEGIASGTPAFMAPEMVTDNRRVDGRADLYALGCVGYWLVTGQLVFEGESAMATLLRHATDTPPPPSSRTELDIPPALEQTILACLEKDPDMRPRNARDLSLRLSKCGTREWTDELAQDWWTRHLPHLTRASSRETSTTGTYS